MNSTLPNFSAVPAPVPGAVPLNPAALSDLGSLAPTTAAQPAEFAALLATNPAAGPAAGSASAIPAAPAAPAPVPAATAACPTVVLAPTTSVAFAAPAVPVAAPSTATPVAPADAAEVVDVALASDSVAQVEEPALEADTEAPSTVISRDTLEQAAAFAATLVQALWPELTAAASPATPAEAPVAPAITADRALPGRVRTGIADQSSQPVVPPTDESPVSEQAAPESTPFEAALAADGAIELKLDRPAGVPATDHTPAASAAIEVHAELALPGRAVVRLTASGKRPQDFAGFTGEAKIAAKIQAGRAPVAAHAGAVERNFVFAGDKQVKITTPSAGIAVAQKDDNMTAAPIEEIRATRPTDPTSAGLVRADFQTVPPPAERITAPATAPSGQNFAERAVSTVTSLVDAQFSASMQKSGSVNLRLKFGGEDLSVRVELRGGAVHTDFQTDSPELRAALTREWQALTSSAPAETRRFLDPVFSPAPASGAPGDGQSQSFGRQAQQQSAQQDLPQRPAREFAELPTPFGRRSSLNESFSPAPLEPRAAAFLPTSLRLSALA